MLIARVFQKTSSNVFIRFLIQRAGIHINAGVIEGTAQKVYSVNSTRRKNWRRKAMSDQLLYQLHIRLNSQDIAMPVVPDVPRVGDIIHVPMKSQKSWFKVTEIVWFFDKFNDHNRIRIGVKVEESIES